MILHMKRFLFHDENIESCFVLPGKHRLFRLPCDSSRRKMSQKWGQEGVKCGVICRSLKLFQIKNTREGLHRAYEDGLKRGNSNDDWRLFLFFSHEFFVHKRSRWSGKMTTPHASHHPLTGWLIKTCESEEQIRVLSNHQLGGVERKKLCKQKNFYAIKSRISSTFYFWLSDLKMSLIPPI
jgi:hypothetical protein